MQKALIKFTLILWGLALALSACNFPGGPRPAPTAKPAMETPGPQEVTQSADQPTPEIQPTEGQADQSTQEAEQPTQTIQPGDVSTETVATKTPILIVIKADGSSVTFTEAELKKIPRDKFAQGKKFFEGPIVLEVLKAAGVTDFKQLTVTTPNATFNFTKSQITPRVILDFMNNGTLRLSAAYMPKSQWVTGVTTLKVQ